MSTGLPVLVALIEFGVIVWLWLSRRNARREIRETWLRARRAELRAVPDMPPDVRLRPLRVGNETFGYTYEPPNEEEQ